jgi:hypothetical protein
MLSRCNPFSPRKEIMKNKLVAIGTLSLITLLSFGKNITNANALISSKPSDYLYGSYYQSYQWFDAVPNSAGTSYSLTPNLFQYRTGTAPFYTYTQDLKQVIVGDAPMTGVAIQAYFHLSNTSFGTIGSDYVPMSVSVGSSSSTNANKAGWTISNGSNNSYNFWIDLSNNVVAPSVDIYYQSLMTQRVVRSSVNHTIEMQQIYVPPQTAMFIDLTTSAGSRYVDGYYLTLSNEYDGQLYYQSVFEQGYIAGYDAAITQDINMLQIFETTFAGVASVLSIQILGNITLGALALFPLLSILILFFKKVIQ